MKAVLARQVLENSVDGVLPLLPGLKVLVEHRVEEALDRFQDARAGVVFRPEGTADARAFAAVFHDAS
ncbi:hypothetical protein [Streptomyces sp. NBC_01497]|uniref:hypothetical protein n=1 Tax=Streptomyces sp. NBC_01497 TaxID=2903885 RepID=UPI002E322D2F|nr:hypothetical protein [Streptomyces sp. NBC_01497]